MSIPYTARVVVHEDVLVQEIPGGESAFVHLGTERYFGLEEVGTEFWRALTETETIQDAYDTLLERYDVEPDRLREDLDEFLEVLREQELIVVRDD